MINIQYLHKTLNGNVFAALSYYEWTYFSLTTIFEFPGASALLTPLAGAHDHALQIQLCLYLFNGKDNLASATSAELLVFIYHREQMEIKCSVTLTLHYYHTASECGHFIPL